MWFSVGYVSLAEMQGQSQRKKILKQQSDKQREGSRLFAFRTQLFPDNIFVVGLESCTAYCNVSCFYQNAY